MTCIRTAWLELDGTIMLLEDETAGYVLTNLDLGSPDIRSVVANRPDQDGTDDQTIYMGARAVSAEVTAYASQIDAVATQFAPYMVPSARPTLHYVLDRPGAPERMVTLRAAAYAWPLQGFGSRDIKLQWVAPDPVILDPEERSATAHAGTTLAPGRDYDLTFPRVYPAGLPATDIVVRSDGDVKFSPHLRIYGPITAPVVNIRTEEPFDYTVAFINTFTIAAPKLQLIQDPNIDTKAKTARYQNDPNQSVLGFLDWANVRWPVLPVHDDNVLSLTGDVTDAVTQVVATWNDGYLT